jgi:putative ABC transport system ATP-binding protein
MANPDGPVFRTCGLTKGYRIGEQQVHALRGVDFEANHGELIVILGSSGLGQIDLPHIVGGLDRASGGELWFQDNLLTSLEETRLTRYRRDHVGFVFQFYNLVPGLTARENVMLVTEIAEHRCRLTKMSADEALDIVGLSGRRNHFPAQRSGGEQQAGIVGDGHRPVS